MTYIRSKSIQNYKTECFKRYFLKKYVKNKELVSQNDQPPENNFITPNISTEKLRKKIITFVKNNQFETEELQILIISKY